MQEYHDCHIILLHCMACGNIAFIPLIRVGSTDQPDLKLRIRIQKRDESLPELAKDVERLTRQAYPDASAEMLEVLSKDPIIDARTDEDFRLRLR